MPNTPAVSQGASVAGRSAPFRIPELARFPPCAGARHQSGRQTSHVGATPAFDPSIRDRFFSDGSPIHATVAHARLRRAGGGIETSVRKGPFHPRSFMRIEDGLYVSTPEMAFCEMASALSLEQLIALGFELCGTYRRASIFGSARYECDSAHVPRRSCIIHREIAPVQRREESSSSAVLHSCRLCFAARKRACHAVVPSLFARRHMVCRTPQ